MRNVNELVAATSVMVYADPESFGLDAQDEPRLDYATTAQLLNELTRRFLFGDNAQELASVAVIDGVHAHLDPASLSYRPANH